MTTVLTQFVAPASILRNGKLISPESIGRLDFEKIVKNKTGGDAILVQRVMSAYHLAKIAFAYNQKKRSSGERYFEHPKAVALIGLLEFDESDPDSIIVDLLHDIVEDTHFTTDYIECTYGKRVATACDLVTNLPKELMKTPHRKTNHYQGIAESDLAAKTKVRDRLHNNRTSNENCGVTKEKAQRKLKETENYIVPIAKSLPDPIYLEKLEESMRLMQKRYNN